MQHPEAYLGRVTDDSFDVDGCLKDGPLKDLVASLAKAFGDWVHLIHQARRLLAAE
jgi:chromate reductase